MGYLMPPQDDGCYLVDATHVCKRWRYLALETPSLWTHVVCTRSPMMTEAYLARSQAMPIAVYAGPGRANALALHTHRIRRLAVDGDGLYPGQLAASTKFPVDLSSSTPLLEDLYIFGNIFLDDLSPVPSLRRLFLRRFFDPAISTLTRSISSLDLTNIGPREGLTYPALIEVLRCSPCVEMITLKTVAVLGIEHPSVRRVALPLLRSLHATDVKWTLFSTLLVNLTLPASATLTYEADDASDPRNVAFPLVFPKGPAEPTPPIPAITDLMVEIKTHRSLTRFDVSLRGYLSLAAPAPSLSLDVAGCAFKPVLSQLVHRGRIETLTITDAEYATPEERSVAWWAAMLADLHALHHLAIVRAPASARFLLHLGALARGADGRVPCPTLSVLMLRNVKASEQGFWEVLERVVSTRREGGAPLDKLVFRHSKSADVGAWYGERLEAIRAHVGTVVVE